MQRLKLIKNHLKVTKLENVNPYEYYNFDYILDPNEKKIFDKFRDFLQNEKFGSLMIKYIQKAVPPIDLIRKIYNEYPGIGSNLSGFGVPQYSNWLRYLMFSQICKIDNSLSTTMAVSILAADTIYGLGSEDQKKKYIEALAKGDLFGCFAITEPESGSDIGRNMKTSAKPFKDGFLINGEKRWVGNGSFADVVILFAKNVENGKIQGFIVEKNMKGFTSKVMEHKLATRGVYHALMYFNDVFIPKENILIGADDFHKGAGLFFVKTRLSIGWNSLGTSIGVFEKALEYSKQMIHSNKGISNIQLIQSRLVLIMGNIQAMLFFVKRVTELSNEGKLNPGKSSIIKAWITEKTRENVRLAKEIFGDNGLLLENYIIQSLLDTEPQFTYEGTYDINMLICGNELTGINSL